MQPKLTLSGWRDSTFVPAGSETRKAAGARPARFSTRGRGPVDRAIGLTISKSVLRASRAGEILHCKSAGFPILPGGLPPELVVPFSTLRSNLHAVNSRITETYESEEEDGIPEERRRLRLGSALIIYNHAVTDYADLCRLLRTEVEAHLPAFSEPPHLREYVAMVRSAASAGEDASDE